MNPKTLNKIRRLLWPVAGILAGVAEVIRASGDITSFTWPELLDKGLKALPFVLIGLVGRSMLFAPPPVDEKDEKKVE